MPTIIPAADRRVRWIALRHPGNGFWASEPTASAALARECDRGVALDVADARRRAQAAQGDGHAALRQAHGHEPELAIEHGDLRGARNRARRRRHGAGRQRDDERQEGGREIHETPASPSAAASAREARPRCDTTSFSSGVSSATVRESPSGTKSGS